MKKEFKENIDRLLGINLEIGSLFQSDSPDSNTNEEGFAGFEAKVEKLLAEKDIVIEKIKGLKAQSAEEFAELRNSEYVEIWQQVQELEAKNMTAMKTVRSLLSKGAVDSKIQAKAIFSYKFNKEVKPRLFDDSL